MATTGTRRYYTRASSEIVIDKGTDEELLCTGLVTSRVAYVIYQILSICSVGLLHLVGHWRPDWVVRWTKRKCSPEEADSVLLKDSFGNVSVEEVLSEVIELESIDDDSLGLSLPGDKQEVTDKTYLMADSLDMSPCVIRVFYHKHSKYVYESEERTFIRLFGLQTFPRQRPEGSTTSAGDTIGEGENHKSQELKPLRGEEDVPGGVKVREILEVYRGLTPKERRLRADVYGPNTIDVEIKSYFSLLISECLNPFYIFQVASITLWSLDDYYYYALCIFGISALSIGISLVETRRQSECLHDLAASKSTQITVVIRNPNIPVRPLSREIFEEPLEFSTYFEEISSFDLVPGDLVAIPAQGCVMPCDVVLQQGTCIVNESMLTGKCYTLLLFRSLRVRVLYQGGEMMNRHCFPTGESVPVTKTSVAHQEDEEFYSPVRHKRHTLFAGTQVIQTRFYGDSHVLGVVVRTGFSTAKGELVRSILYPKPIGFKFYQDSIKFIGILFCVAACGMVYCTWLYVSRGADAEMIILRTLDIITIVVPPALPAAMTVGTVYAQARLKKKGIFCISPPRINISGRTKLFCFDKTGTLTEDGLDFYEVVPAYSPAVRDVSALQSSQTPTIPHPLVVAMASCHSLTVINEELTGDPLDVKMFQATHWELVEPSSNEDSTRFDMLIPTIVKPAARGDSSLVSSLSQSDIEESEFQFPLEVGILRQFPFSSETQRMSVVTRTLGKREMEVFVKGAPEKIIALCSPSSIPSGLTSLLSSYTKEGFRVLAVGMKSLPKKVTWHQAQRMKREELEVNLTYLGILVMQNALKPATTPTIRMMKAAGLGITMVTGDDILTAMSVGRNCSLVSGSIVQIKTWWTEVGEPRLGFELQREAEDGSQPLPSRDISFAMTGVSWSVLRNHFPDLLPYLALQCKIYARMAPDQKAQLVELYQELGYIVGMCGDGANDCGALKAAHVGISLSESEASVAAPFTSRVPDITCVPTLIQEGRCALTTSFAVFKYMALYSIVQFVSVLILYTHRTNLGDVQFLYIDLVITTTVAVLMGRTEPIEKLVPHTPPASLLGISILASIFIQILLTIAGQAAAFLLLRAFSLYVPNNPPADVEVVACWETTTIFIVSSFQYLILATVFSKGKPFRKPVYTNVLFITAVLVLSATNVFLLLYPPTPLALFMELVSMNDAPFPSLTHAAFKQQLLIVVAFNFIISFAVEYFLVERLWFRNLLQWIVGKRTYRTPYKRMYNELSRMSQWPPLGRVLTPAEAILQPDGNS
ncbi:unnamed protein product [Cyprideis torosa]|uniref:Cation-transporting ATPase n=1 Tax=Cyprideis torosa TaxID=163714 RepID=A0A7R8ZL58_9CRUS|nr:unnamed protein product [Cyprideis torosa]CAG0885909.1 unnamed protein product [Cyprideis torosa]